MIKAYIKSNSKFYLLIVTLVIGYFLITFLKHFFTALSVIEFPFITICFGLAPAYFFRRVMKFDHIIGWMINASFFGILLIPVIFLLFGWFHLNFVFIYSVSFLYGCSLLGVIILILFSNQLKIEESISFTGIKFIDLFLLFFIFAFTIVLTLRNFSGFYPKWDTFTFWGIDAKYIFENNRLRDASLDVLRSVKYTSFFPLYYSIVYDLYGRIFEQYAAWINVYFNFLASLLVYFSLLKKSLLQKLLVTIIMLMVFLPAVNNAFVFSIYAEVICALMILGFMIVLTNDYETENISTYIARFFLLNLIALTFFLIKNPYIYYTAILVFALIVYDRKFLRKNWLKIAARLEFWCGLLFIASIILLRFLYFNEIKTNSDLAVSYGLHLGQFPPSFALFSKYIIDLTAHIIQHSPHLVGIFLLAVFSIFFAKRPSKKYYWLYFLSAGLPLIPCIEYIVFQISLNSISLPRYITITMYLLPLVFSYVNMEMEEALIQKRIKITASAILFLSFSSLVFLQLALPVLLNGNFKLITGTYNTALLHHYHLAQEVLRVSDPESKILIADDYLEQDKFSNKDDPAIYVRYFLMDNSTGGQYEAAGIKNLVNYAKSEDADAILILSYSNTISGCETFFMEEHNYLIKLQPDRSMGTGTCSYSSYQIYDFGR